MAHSLEVVGIRRPFLGDPLQISFLLAQVVVTEAEESPAFLLAAFILPAAVGTTGLLHQLSLFGSLAVPAVDDGLGQLPQRVLAVFHSFQQAHRREDWCADETMR